ncbi:MAG: protein-glutamate O-methyltransferase [Gammaproteobacteria bacterium]|nr:protein-glutamate O-methyltransferase [Gammaproteobacteria bacterium]
MARDVTEREFEFTSAHFHTIKGYIAEHAGIALADSKQQMVYSRLVRRLRAKKIPDFDTYLKYLDQDDGSELINFINALTTNLTSFFRENHHFEYLTESIFPLLEQENASSRKIRIWSAGCSTGEEPYSIAITAREYFQSKPDWDVQIFASDLDSNVVQTAQDGIYAMDRVKGIASQRLKKWFLKGKGAQEGLVRVKPELQSILNFRQLNLLHTWPWKETFDIIFCRNVVIYFNKDTQRVLFGRFFENMVSEGHLLIGHSESLNNVSDRFKLIGKTIYRKSEA